MIIKKLEISPVINFREFNFPDRYKNAKINICEYICSSLQHMSKLEEKLVFKAKEF